jgi:hypothetical protein
MRQLPKDKRNRLIMVIGITVMVLAGLWFGLIKYQQRRLEDLAERKSSVQTKLDKVQQLVKNADFVEAEMVAASKKLSDLEGDMVTGDPYAWMFSKLKEFKSSYKDVDMPQLVLQTDTKESSLLPKFPYEQARFTIQGTAFYHDLGKFLADFENNFPLFRVLNLDLGPAPLQADTTEKDREKLQFKMEVICPSLLPPVKTGA